jgi:hypothetical protein
MRWGRIAVLLFTGVVGLALGLIVAEPWDGPTRVDAVQLDDDVQGRREDDAFDGEVRDDDDDDDDDTGRRRAAAATDDGRDGTRDGDTSGNRGTGTGIDGGTDDGRDGTRDGDTGGNRGTGTGSTNTGGGFVPATDDGGGATGGGGGGGTTGGGGTGGGGDT